MRKFRTWRFLVRPLFLISLITSSALADVPPNPPKTVTVCAECAMNAIVEPDLETFCKAKKFCTNEEWCIYFPAYHSKELQKEWPNICTFNDLPEPTPENPDPYEGFPDASNGGRFNSPGNPFEPSCTACYWDYPPPPALVVFHDGTQLCPPEANNYGSVGCGGGDDDGDGKPNWNDEDYSGSEEPPAYAQDPDDDGIPTIADIAPLPLYVVNENGDLVRNPYFYINFGALLYVEPRENFQTDEEYIEANLAVFLGKIVQELDYPAGIEYGPVLELFAKVIKQEGIELTAGGSSFTTAGNFVMALGKAIENLGKSEEGTISELINATLPVGSNIGAGQVQAFNEAIAGTIFLLDTIFSSIAESPFGVYMDSDLQNFAKSVTHAIDGLVSGFDGAIDDLVAGMQAAPKLKEFMANQGEFSPAALDELGEVLMPTDLTAVMNISNGLGGWGLGLKSFFASAALGFVPVEGITINDQDGPAPTTNTIGDPIDTRTGAFNYEKTDFVIPGRGIDFALTRTYDSSDHSFGLFGFGFKAAFLEAELRENYPDRGFIQVSWGDGRHDLFFPTAANPPLWEEGEFWDGIGNFGRIRRARATAANKLEPGCINCESNERPSYVLRDPNGFQYFFCPMAHFTGFFGKRTAYLKKIVDPNGNAIVINRDEYGKPTKVIDTLSREITFTYNKLRFISSVTDPAGNVYRYEYDLPPNIPVYVGGEDDSDEGGDAPVQTGTQHTGTHTPDFNNSGFIPLPASGSGNDDEPLPPAAQPNRAKNTLIKVIYPETKYLNSTYSVANGNPYEAYTYYAPAEWINDGMSAYLNLKSIERGGTGEISKIEYYSDPDHPENFDMVSATVSAGKRTEYSFEKPESPIPVPNGGSPFSAEATWIVTMTDAEGFVTKYFHGPLEPGGFDAGLLHARQRFEAPGSAGDSELALFTYNEDFLLTQRSVIADGRTSHIVREYDVENQVIFSRGNLLRQMEISDLNQGQVIVTATDYEPIANRPSVVTDNAGNKTYFTYQYQEDPEGNVENYFNVKGWGIDTAALGEVRSDPTNPDPDDPDHVNPLPGSTPTPIPETVGYNLGDINGDGLVGAFDGGVSGQNGAAFELIRITSPPVDVYSDSNPDSKETKPLQTLFKYNTFGQQIEEISPNGTRKVTEYGGGYPVRIVADAGGLALSTAMTYDGVGRVLSTVRNDGLRQDLNYDTAGHLIQKVLSKPGSSTVIVRQSFYDLAGRLVTERKPFSAASAGGLHGYDSVQVVQMPEEFQTLTRYNSGDVVSQFITNIITPDDVQSSFVSSFYDSRWNLISAQTSDGIIKDVEFDGYGNAIKVTRRTNGTTEPGLDAISTVEYENSRPKHEYSPINTDGEGENDKSTTTYDGFGRVSTVTTESGRVTRITYDNAGNISNKKITDLTGSKVYYETSSIYDALGRLVREETHNKKLLSDGSVVTFTPNGTDPGPQKVIREYRRGLNSEWVVTDPSGMKLVSGTLFDKLGRKRESFVGKDKVFGTKWSYDSDGQVVAEERYYDPYELSGSNPQGSSPSAGRGTSASKLAVPLLNSPLQPSGGTSGATLALETTRFFYDLGRITRVLYPDNTETKTFYDSHGRVARTEDARGSSLTYTYDSGDRVVQVTEQGMDLNGTTPITRVTKFKHDVRGNITEIEDPEGNKTIFVYNKRGLLKEKRYTDNTQTTYIYDQLDRVIDLTKSPDVRFESSYNSDGLPEFMEVTGDAAEELDNSTIQQVFQYDALNNLKRVDETMLNPQTSAPIQTTTVKRTYSSLGNLLSETTSMPNVISTDSKLVYNNGAALPTEITYPLGVKVRPVYDSAGRVRQVNTVPYGTISTTTQFKGPLPVAVTLGTGTSALGIRNTFNKMNRLKTRAINFGNGNLLARFTYAYDENGNITARGREKSISSGVKAYLETLSYDGFDRLRVSTLENTSSASAIEIRDTAWNFDKIDNFLNFSDSVSGAPPQVSSSAVNALNQYESFGAIDSITYNPRGEETSRVQSGAVTMTRDLLGRVVKVQKAGSQIKYAYDGLGRLIVRQKVGGGIRRFHNLGDALVAFERDEDGGGFSERKFQFVSGAHGRWRVDQDGEGVYLDSDASGNVAVGYDHNGIQEEYFYTPYGELFDPANPGTVPASNIDNEFFFLGKYRDPDTGFDVLGARFYDSKMGRFLSRDPLGEEISPNLYQYGFSNPLRFVDPSGMGPELAVDNNMLPQSEIDAIRAFLGGSVEERSPVPPISPICTVGTSCIGGSRETQVDYEGVESIKEIIAGGLKTGALIAVGYATGGLSLSAQVIISAAASFTVEGGGEAGADAAVTDVLMNMATFGVGAGIRRILSSINGESIVQSTAKALSGVDDAAAAGQKLTSEAASPPGFCFTAGTLVSTDDGLVPIEKIEVGDLVWSFNEQTGKAELQPVERTFVHQAEEILVIEVGDERIEVTPEHPFYVDGKWVKAGDLRVGDKLTMLDQLNDLDEGEQNEHDPLGEVENATE